MLLASAALNKATSAQGDAPTADLDRYGGWKGKTFKATGYFRLENDGDRWWFVSPEGNAFLSFGINHLHPDLWRQPFNQETWAKRFGLPNLDNYQQFAKSLRTWFLDTCRDYGFNTVGVHASLSVANRPHPQLPYLRPIHFVDIPHWKTAIPDENFLDVFSDAFASRCESMAEEAAAPLADDPYLLGYAMTDCPLLTEEDCRERPDVIGGAKRSSRIGWPRRLRNLGADAAGKQAYTQTMRQLYRDDIGAFNTTYNTTFTSFDALQEARHWRPHTDLSNGNETRDNVEFLKVVVARYYQTAKDAIRRHDPHHLFFGDKINANTDTLDTLLPITSRYTDVIFYQMYAQYEIQEPGLDRWSKLTEKPFVNGDSAYTMIGEHMPRPYGPVADSLAQRAEWTKSFFHRAFARPDFVGWHYCGLIDASQLVGRKQDRQHSGLMNGHGKPYPELKHVITACSRDLYHIATKHS